MDWELPLIIKFVVAFVIVFALIVATFWLLRRFGGTRLGGNAARGRQPRLAVIDAAAVDGRRRLVLIRRDNVEHLLMIGGPSDVVIEQNIVRAVPVASARDMPMRGGPTPGEPRPEAVQRMGEAATSWPTQSESSPRTPRPALANEEEPWPLQPHPEPVARPSRNIEPMPRVVTGSEPLPRPEPLPRAEPTARSEPTPRSETPTRLEQPARAERREPRQAPPLDVPPARPSAPPPAASKPAAESAPPTQQRPPPLAPDANLADMAQRLEAALRRPIVPPDGRSAEPPGRPAPAAEPAARRNPSPAPPAPREAAKNEPTPQPTPAQTAPTRAPQAETKPASPKSVLDSLEEEMASLLGRPASKE